MAHLAYWPSQHAFFPFGDTSPVNLAELVPQNRDADILLLGCGDPRNIFFTILSCSADDPLNTRKFDFTCCDIEPAVMARNVILFSLIVDDDYETTKASLWNIYYDVLLDDKTLSILISRSKLLAEFAEDMRTWHTSKYSSLLKIISGSTLEQLRHYWTWYADTEKWSADRQKLLKIKVMVTIKKVANWRGGIFMGISPRSAGPMWMHAISSLREAYRRWWDTGLTSQNAAQAKSAVNLNPTFAYNSHHEGFLTHYCTAPIIPFHLSPAYNPLQPSPGTNLPDIDAEHLYREAMSQFQSWCDAFRRCVKLGGRIVIRVAVCDCLSLCQTLQENRSNGQLSAACRVTPWTASVLTLRYGDYSSSGRRAPNTFDVIDTSNLSDSIGMLNLLIVAPPLLKKTPWATFYTETQLRTSDEPAQAIQTSLGVGLSTTGILFDMTPVSYISRFDMRSNVHECVAIHLFDNNEQYFERLAWKRPSQLGKPGGHFSFGCDPVPVSELLFNIYIRMFEHEGVKSLVSRKRTSTANRKGSPIHYCRQTFALLIFELQRRVATDWGQVFLSLLKRIENADSLLYSKGCYQDLLCQLHLLGLYTTPKLEPGNLVLSASKDLGPFRDWISVPSVVCVVLVVPRSTVQPLNDPKLHPNPPLMVEIAHGDVTHNFTFLETSHGMLNVEGDAQDAVPIVQENADGAHGNSPWVVSFWVPTWILLDEPAQTTVRLFIMRSQATAGYEEVLGHHKRLLDTSLVDVSCVRIFSQRPSVSKRVPAPIPYSKQTTIPRTHEVIEFSLDEACNEVKTFVVHAAINDPEGKALLTSKNNAVKVEYLGRSSVLLKIGLTWTGELVFPAVVNVPPSKLRYSRDNPWVEVTAFPVALEMGNTLDGIPVVNHFPILNHEGIVFSWNIPFIEPARLPQLSTENPTLVHWIGVHLRYAHSDKERDQIDRQVASSALAPIKANIHTMFTVYAGYKSAPRTDVFALRRVSGGAIEYLIFVAGLHLDLASHTVVADAFVMQMTTELRNSLSKNIDKLLSLSSEIILFESSVAAWRYLFPALAERCRNWEHTETCVYRTSRSTFTTKDTPVCTCGNGKVTDIFSQRKDWTAFSPYVTRIAISPLFAVSYLDTIGKDNEEAVRDHGLSGKGVLDLMGGGLAAASPPVSSGQCAKCRTPLPEGKRMVCSRCKKVAYCSRDCQTSHWGIHKPLCVS